MIKDFSALIFPAAEHYGYFLLYIHIDAVTQILNIYPLKLQLYYCFFNEILYYNKTIIYLIVG